ncbi:MAG: AI-2E family transporter YdiK, partial [Acidobacteriota bacterium]
MLEIQQTTVPKKMEPHRDITRTFLGVLFLGGLIGSSLWVLKPFLGAVIWAVTIVTATWPLMTSIQRCLWGRRWMAVVLMTLILLCVLVVPLWLAIGTIVSNADRIADWLRSLATFEVPPPPAWLYKLPLLGQDLAVAWEKVAVVGLHDFMAKLAPYGSNAVRWFITEVGGFGALVLQFLLTVVFSALLYSNGENAATWVKRFGRRLAG